MPCLTPCLALLLLVVTDRQLALHMVKVVDGTRREVERVLDVNNILTHKGLVCKELK